MSVKISKWSGNRKNETILTLTRKHIELTKKAVHQLYEMVQSSGENPSSKKTYHKTISSHEEGADVLRREMIEELAKRDMLPEERDDLMELVRAVDWIADCCKAASRLLMSIPFEKAPEVFRKSIEDMCREDYECVKVLGESINELSRNPKKALELADQVELFEEDIDDLYSITRSHFVEIAEGTMTRGAMILLNEFIDSVETIADWCENSADIVRVIAIRVI
ncbi:DUF47 family protein [Candidatus Bathyarchaeota archaeon]|nr:DUF47 family protein [Candidatus Bathyarchaeota archaeon]TFH19106.1 MAG: DUF47 family protein [Candidatus Bathyarchaeota archaeon]